MPKVAAWLAIIVVANVSRPHDPYDEGISTILTPKLSSSCWRRRSLHHPYDDRQLHRPDDEAISTILTTIGSFIGLTTKQSPPS